MPSVSEFKPQSAVEWSMLLRQLKEMSWEAEDAYRMACGVLVDLEDLSLLEAVADELGTSRRHIANAGWLSQHQRHADESPRTQATRIKREAGATQKPTRPATS